MRHFVIPQPVKLATLLSLAFLAHISFESVAQAQRGGFGGGGGGRMPTPEESFQRMDRNQNGLIDPDEIQQLPGFLKDMYARAGVDGSRAINLQEFQGVSQKLREQMEQGRANGGFQFRGSEGGGGPPRGEMRPSGGDSERREISRSEEPADQDFRRDDRDRRRDDRDSSSSGGNSKDSSSSKTAKKDKKLPKPRITKDLPDEYRDRDKNGDGQIALHEWERSAFSKFYELDRNGDGFLTPSELLPPPSKSDKDKKDKKGTATSTSATTDAKPSSSSSTTADTSDSSKPSDSAKSSSDKKPAASDSSPDAVAFLSLDVNKDGQLTSEEWDRSRNTRRRFERAKIAVTLPIKQAQFAELYRKTAD